MSGMFAERSISSTGCTVNGKDLVPKGPELKSAWRDVFSDLYDVGIGRRKLESH